MKPLQNICSASRQRYTNYPEHPLPIGMHCVCPGCGKPVKLFPVGNGMPDMIPTHSKAPIM